MIRGYVLTGGREQYDFFVKWNNLNPSEFPMLKSINQLQDKTNIIILKYGTYYMNSLYKEVVKFEETNKKRGAK